MISFDVLTFMESHLLKTSKFCIKKDLYMQAMGEKWTSKEVRTKYTGKLICIKSIATPDQILNQMPPPVNKIVCCVN